MVCALGCLRVKGDIEVRGVETERAARRAAALNRRGVYDPAESSSLRRPAKYALATLDGKGR